MFGLTLKRTRLDSRLLFSKNQSLTQKRLHLLPGIWRDIPRALFNRTPDEIAALFVREIEQGIEGTGIKAGIIKVANDAEGVTREGELILRAAARAARQTGVRISTHSFAPNRVGEQQGAIFEDEGFDLNRVYIGHSNDSTTATTGAAWSSAAAG